MLLDNWIWTLPISTFAPHFPPLKKENERRMSANAQTIYPYGISSQIFWPNMLVGITRVGKRFQRKLVFRRNNSDGTRWPSEASSDGPLAEIHMSDRTIPSDTSVSFFEKKKTFGENFLKAWEFWRNFCRIPPENVGNSVRLFTIYWKK